MPVAGLVQTYTAIAAVIAADVWKAFPSVLTPMLAGLHAIPRDVYGAIEVDGGNALRKLQHVTLPHLLL